MAQKMLKEILKKTKKIKKIFKISFENRDGKNQDNQNSQGFLGNITIYWKMAIVVLFLAIIFIFLIFFNSYLYQKSHGNQKKHIGVVNITGIVDEFVRSQAQRDLSQQQIKENVKKFGEELEKVVHDLSDKKRAVLFPSEAVIAGATDYTDEVQKDLSSLILQLPEPNTGISKGELE